MNNLQYKYTLRLNDNVLQVRIPKKAQNNRYIWNTLRHCNAEYEIHILLKGRIPVEIEESLIPLEARQGILILPGKYHTPLYSNEELEHLAISFSFLDGELANIIHRDIQNYRQFNITTEMLQECLSIFHEYNVCSTYCNEKIAALLTSLMISILRNLNLSASSTPFFSIPELERAEIIDNFFGLETDECLKSKYLAEKLHISERQLNRVIHKLYGMTFQEKLTQSRMDRATWLLRTTNKKIDEIADLIGYSSVTAFYQAFKKYFQITPQKYRIALKKTSKSR